MTPKDTKLLTDFIHCFSIKQFYNCFLQNIVFVKKSMHDGYPFCQDRTIKLFFALFLLYGIQNIILN